jgi:metal transporter CNNM
MWITYLIVIVLVLLSGLFSGLTLGLLSLDLFDLRRKVKLGNKDATKIYPLRKQGNLLLVTLLLGNVAVNSTLAVFLGSITAGVFAGLISTGLIVIFGEIIPQAVFSRHALKLGAKTTWLVYFFLYLLYPISKPLAIMLDKTLGAEMPTIFSKKEFRFFLKEQRNLKTNIKNKEFKILEKGLIFSVKKVRNVMTPRVNIYMLSQKTKLSKKTLENIHQRGHTRIPVYNNSKDKVVGMLYVKDLITIDPNDAIMVKKVMRKNVEYVNYLDPLDKILEKFQKKRVHVFLVRGKFHGISGLVTLEDILEEIVGEIVDEYDLMVDMRKIKKK